MMIGIDWGGGREGGISRIISLNTVERSYVRMVKYD